jgi:molecular chaperone GrpE
MSTQDTYNQEEHIDETREQNEAVLEDIETDSDQSDSSTDEQKAESEEERLMREREEYLQGWQRAQAEIANLKRRHEEERKMFTALGREALVKDLIPMLDNFNAAFANTEVWESVDENWRRGIEYIHSQFLQVLEDNGVVAYGVVGDEFDAQLHEPLESEGEGETVQEVVQKGYKIGEKVIRPAKVKLG